jgi:transposase
MPAAVRLREDYSAEALRALARRSKDVNQSHRLLSLAAVRDGMDRGSAAKIGGMDRQTLRDWVHRFNASGPDGVLDNWTEGPKPRLSPEQLAAFAQIVEAGPDRERDGVVRWRRIDLKRVIAEKFGVDFHPRYVGKLLHELGFSHMSAKPRNPAQDERIVEALKKFPARAAGSSRRPARDHTRRSLVPGRGPDRPEERPRSSMGSTRDGPPTSAMTTPICSARFARRGASEPPWRCPTPTPTSCSFTSTRLRATSPKAPRRAASRQSWMAHHGQARRARQHHLDLPAFARTGTQSGRERLAVSAPQLALQHRLRQL